ncbi:MAG TPA: MlaD family protein [Solirubrobacteraceae bacterium]|nr:MlaD family protein [Solirubrobacteraceae bacterium]
MATTSPPPGPSASPPPSGPAGGARSTARARRSGRLRAAVFGALALVVLIVAYLVFVPAKGASYKLEFAEADQLVRGDQVEVGGVPVGSVTNIELTHDYKAVVTIHVDSSLVPLHHGTVAQVRVPSLTTVANRYIQLALGPNNYPAYPAGATLPASVTREVTDLDALFDTLNPKTRKGLQGVIRGFAETYLGQGHNFSVSTEYFPPAISAATHFFSELTREQPVFTKFLVESAKAVTTIGARQESLADLIENQNKTFQAVGANQRDLARGLKQLPGALRQGNKTFSQLPATFAALSELVKASRGPVTQAQNKLLDRLRPLLVTATPVVHEFSQVFSRPGADNDLTDLARALPALAKRLTTASPVTVTALKESVPITAVFGPYAPDLAGTLRTFGEGAGYYDADGHYIHATPVLPDFTLGEDGTLKPAGSAEAALAGLETGQLRRCPGAATEPAEDGSSPFVDGELLSCDPTETP